MTRVLVVAPSVDPTDVGEAWVGAQWVMQLAQEHDVTLLTYRKRERAPYPWSDHGVEVHQWLEPPLIGRAERFNSLLKPWYPDFDRRCRAWLRNAMNRGQVFDVGFQPTPVAMRYPSPLRVAEFPYVLGPLGGGLDSPIGFASEDTAPWYVGLRRADDARLRFDPWLRRSFERAAVVLAIAPYAVQALHRHLELSDVRVMSETALSRLPELRPRESISATVRLLYVGRLIRTKGARDAVRAMSYLRDLPVHLDVVGDGFDRIACERTAHELGVDGLVTFHGAQTREDVERFYARADVFVFPSYREPGGNVQFEAMGHGLPLVLADRGGPAASASRDSAFMVTPREPEQYARDIADSVRRLVEDPTLRRSMGAAARSHVEATGTWPARVASLEGILAEAAGSS